MHVLLADVVAAEPDEMVPVAHLVLHFRHSRLAFAEPRLAAVPVSLQQDDFADLAVVDILDLVDVALLVMPLQADNNFEILLVGQLVGLQQRAEAGGVDATRLLHEDVLAGLDGRGVMDGAETGRRGDQHHVGTRRNRLLVGVETDEHAILGQIDLVAILLLQLGGATLGPIGKGVGHGDQLDVVHGIEAILRRPGAAATAADQGNLQFITSGGVGRPRDIQSAGQGKPRCHGRAIFQKISARRHLAIAHRDAPRKEGKMECWEQETWRSGFGFGTRGSGLGTRGWRQVL